ncbi:MAG: hypothetical protein R2873_35870 [Caldilineaceae bacterium]
MTQDLTGQVATVTGAGTGIVRRVLLGIGVWLLCATWTALAPPGDSGPAAPGRSARRGHGAAYRVHAASAPPARRRRPPARTLPPVARRRAAGRHPP